MKHTTKLLIITLILVLSSQIVSSHYLELDLNDEVFKPGETIRLNATIQNTKNQIVTLRVEAILQEKNMQSTPYPVSYEVELQPYSNTTLTLYNLTVDDNFYDGFYNIKASIIENQFRVVEEEIDFEVTGSPDDMIINLIIANNPSYSNPMLVFVKNEKIYIKIDCPAENPVYTAILTRPDNTFTQISIPITLTADDVGSYKITVQAKAQGYRNASLTEYFAVIEHEPFQEEVKNDTLPIVAIVVVVIIIICILFLKMKKTKNK